MFLYQNWVTELPFWPTHLRNQTRRVAAAATVYLSNEMMSGFICLLL